MVENEKNRISPSYPTIPISVYFRDFCVLKNRPFCVRCPPFGCRQSAVYSVGCPPTERRQSAVCGSSERRLPIGLSADCRRCVRRLPTVRRRTNEKGAANGGKRVGNQHVVAAKFPHERSAGDFCAILRRSATRTLVVKNATNSANFQVVFNRQTSGPTHDGMLPSPARPRPNVMPER